MIFPLLACLGQARLETPFGDCAQVCVPQDIARLYDGDLQRRQVSAARRHEFLWGREAAAQALAGAGLVQARSLRIGRDGDGAPQWPAGWIGSITHSKGLYCAIAARRDHYLAVGVDAERLRGAAMDRAIGRICLVAGDDASAAPTLLFSAKEAIYKACHPRIGGRLWFTDFTVSQVDPRGSFQWQFNPDPALRGTGSHRTTPSHVLTCVALTPDHALAARQGPTPLLQQKETV